MCPTLCSQHQHRNNCIVNQVITAYVSPLLDANLLKARAMFVLVTTMSSAPAKSLRHLRGFVNSFLNQRIKDGGQLALHTQPATQQNTVRGVPSREREAGLGVLVSKSL